MLNLYLQVFFLFGACIAPSLTFTLNANANNRSESTNALVFKADFSKSTISQAFGGAPVSYGENNANMWASGGGVDVVFKAGTFGAQNGFGIYTEHRVETSTAHFKYSVFFPADFNFVKGGKLSGLYGGKKNCAGGDPARDCFSTRLMWRTGGQAELYMYINRDAQDPAICQMPNNHCNEEYGWSLNRGSFTWPRGVWTDVQETIRLNTPGQRDGLIEVKINGQTVIRYTNIVYRISAFPNMKVEGMHVSTFFGGSSQEWATPTRQVAKFKEFILENGLSG